MPKYESLSNAELLDNLVGLDEELANNGRRMGDWDLEFCDSILSRPPERLSEKQRKIIIRILRTY